LISIELKTHSSETFVIIAIFSFSPKFNSFLLQQMMKSGYIPQLKRVFTEFCKGLVLFSFRWSK